jgi:O-antigen/teichoic acid export membrane protein
MLSKFKQLVKDSLTYSVGSIVARIIGFFLIPVYTRVFTPDEYGTIELLLTFQGFLIAFMQMGTSAAQTRYFYENDEKDFRREVVSTTLYFRTLWGALITAICILAASAFNQFLFDGAIPNSYFYLTFLVALFSVVLDCLVVVYRLLLLPVPYLILTLSQSLLSSAVIILLVVYFKQGITGYLVGYAAAIFLLIPVAVILLRGYIVPRFSRSLIKKMLKFGIPLMPTVVAVWVISFADRYFLNEYTTLSEVGLYAVGAKFALAIVLITGAFRLAWTPLALSVAKEPDARSFYRNMAKLYLVAASFLTLMLTGVSKLVMVVMTQPDFYAGYTIIGILAYGAVFYGLYAISTLGLWLAEKTVFGTIAIAINAGLVIGLNVALIPIWGIMGAALATLISYIIGNIIAFYFCEKYYPIGINYFEMSAITLVTCLGIALQLLLLGSSWPLFLQYTLIVVVWVVIGLFFTFKIIGMDRIRVVRDATVNYLRQRKGADRNAP